MHLYTTLGSNVEEIYRTSTADCTASEWRNGPRCNGGDGDRRRGCQIILHLIAGVEASPNCTWHTTFWSLGINNHMNKNQNPGDPLTSSVLSSSFLPTYLSLRNNWTDLIIIQPLNFRDEGRILIKPNWTVKWPKNTYSLFRQKKS